MSHPLHDRVPVAVVAKYIRRWLDYYHADHMHEKGGYVDSSADNEGSLGILAFQCGVSGRRLRMVLNDKMTSGRGGNVHLVDHVSFDMADKIVCATAGPLAWHTEEDLIPFYGPLTVTAKEIKQGFELPEGFDFDSLPSAKRYQWSNARMAAAA